MTMGAASWGYHRFDRFWKSTTALVRNLVEIASKGGNFLLNVGPDAKGRIPAPCVERLKEIGQWMEVNGESIYGSEAGPIQDASWGKTTQKDGTVYLHVFDWPADGTLAVRGLAGSKSARILVSGDTLPSTTAGKDLTIKLPAAAPDPNVSVIAVET